MRYAEYQDEVVRDLWAWVDRCHWNEIGRGKRLRTIDQQERRSLIASSRRPLCQLSPSPLRPTHFLLSPKTTLCLLPDRHLPLREGPFQ